MNDSKPLLFTPIRFGRVEAKNRVMISPMCMYAAEDGFASTWHVAHLGARAIGGAGVVMMEATAVEARGRITDLCLGIYKDEHVEKLKEITEFIKSQGSVPGIQLSHAGRKGSRQAPWLGRDLPLPEDKAWEVIAPSAVPFEDEHHLVPKEATISDIAEIRAAFVAGAKRAIEAGFEIINLQFAHGYLVSSFLSPLANFRTDEYGGSFDNRIRLACEIITDIKEILPENYPLFVRISCSDLIEGGWTIDDSVLLACRFKELGVDLVDCSSSGNAIPKNFDWSKLDQVAYSARIHRQAGIPTGAVGGIISPRWAEKILREKRATVISIARASLDDPNWPMHAAYELGVSAHFSPIYDIWIGEKTGFSWREYVLPARNKLQIDGLEPDDE